MVCFYTEVNVVDAVLFAESHVNSVVTSMLDILKKNKNGTTLPRCGPEGYER